MELLIQSFHYLHNKNTRTFNLLRLKKTVINYLKLTYALLLYLLKLSLIRTLILLKKLVPFRIRPKIKQILFYNKKVWKYLIFFKKWAKTPPTINQIRHISNILFQFIYIIFIPLFIIVVKKERWKILMLEKLKNNLELKDQFIKFTNNTKIPINKKLAFEINTENLNKSELEIFEKLNQALFSIK